MKLIERFGIDRLVVAIDRELCITQVNSLIALEKTRMVPELDHCAHQAFTNSESCDCSRASVALAEF